MRKSRKTTVAISEDILASSCATDVDAERVERAARRLRELETSGVGAAEILGGEAGTAFIRDDCGGDPDVAAAAFALVHTPAGRDRAEGYREGRG